MPVQAVIADDEAELAQHLARELAKLWPELEVVALAANGVEALAQIERLRPQIAFLDIRMPGLTGLEVARRLNGDCRVVFVTAYDQYAVEAFERAAVDYLLKPISPERLAKTVARLRDGAAAPAAVDLAALLASLRQALPAPPEYLRWIRAGIGERVELIAVDEVHYFLAADKYTSVVTQEREYLIRTALKELAGQLDPQRFWQIHRGTIVNVERVAAVQRDFGGRLSLTLRGRSEPLKVSRGYSHLFRQM